MDAIRTLLLARTHVVVLDADLAASAATRPSRDSDLDKFEDELAQLGFVMSLDLAITIRRLPNQAIQELRTWMFDTLVRTTGSQRPSVPLSGVAPKGTPQDPTTLYLRRVLTWLSTRPDQPCPWCAKIKAVGALDPCGHLVCRTCWDGGNYAGCPICHRRVTPGEPFVAAGNPTVEHVMRHEGQLRLLHLAFDLAGTARVRFEQLISRATPLSPDDRAEVETVIDTLGPKAATWLPAKIPVKETMAIVLARLWMVSPDRAAILRATSAHLGTATDVLRVATVLMGGNARLVAGKPASTRAGTRLGSIRRGLRRVVLEALDQIPTDHLLEDMQCHREMWKRAGERLHPFEYAKRLPNAALAFAVIRGTDVTRASFGPSLQAHAAEIPRARTENDRVRITSWGGVIEDGLRRGDVRGVVELLAQRPGELLRRADHLVRMTQRKQPDALPTVLGAIQEATRRGAPAALLTLGGHVAQRGTRGPRRIFFPDSDVLAAWSMPDHRIPLPVDAIGSITAAVRGELVRRAEGKPRFARAVIDRGLCDLRMPIGERAAAKARIAWPRGSEIAAPRTIDLAARRLRWLDVHIQSKAGLDQAGAFRTALAHLGDDFADLASARARPTLWDIACIHAASRANLVYVRERDGSVIQFRRRDGEPTAGRLARLLANVDDDGTLAAVPPANAPTWFALLDDTIAFPKGSEGYFLDAKPTTGITRLDASDLVAQLVPRP